MIKITIQEVSEKYNLTKDTLRYYEKEGLIGPITKNASGVRDYSEADLARIEFVKCMRSAGLSIGVLREYMRLYDEGDYTKDERIKLLEDERDALKEKIRLMQDAYKKLEFKIQNYQKGIW